jgi:arylsulfatase
VGCDTVSPVSDLYESPFPFTGEIINVMVDVSEATFDELGSSMSSALVSRWRRSRTTSNEAAVPFPAPR